MNTVYYWKSLVENPVGRTCWHDNSRMVLREKGFEIGLCIWLAVQQWISLWR